MLGKPLLLVLLFPTLASCIQSPSYTPAGRLALLIRPSGPYNGQSTNKKRISRTSQSSLTALRAGSILPLATTTAKVTSAFLGINGIALLTRPNLFAEKVHGITPVPEDKKELNSWMLRATGALGLGIAIQIYASVVATGITPLAAMGLGLIPRASFFVATIVSGTMTSLGIQSRLFTVNTLLTCWCAASLILGLGNPAQTAKMFSFMSLVKSVLFVGAPQKVSVKLLNETSKGRSLGLMRVVGNELMTSAILMVSAAWGSSILSPATAAGVMSLSWAALLADMAWVNKTWRLLGSDNPRSQLANMVVAIFCGAGFLLAR
jgi:hypothetical protein